MDALLEGILGEFTRLVGRIVLSIFSLGRCRGERYLGGEAAQASLQISDKAARVFQGMLLFFVLSCDTLIHYRIRLVWAKVKDTIGGAA